MVRLHGRFESERAAPFCPQIVRVNGPKEILSRAGALV